MPESKNHYELLGISRRATQDEISRAYQEFAKKYHPDKTGGDKNLEENLKGISAAYDTLKHPERRTQYDQSLAAKEGVSGRADETSAGSRGGRSDSIEASAQEGSENPSPSKPSRAANRKALRRKTAKFISVFVVSVFVFLFGYELARFSKANDWYLLHVAQSTTFLLKHIGYSCELGSAERYRGMETGIRAALDAFRRGETPPQVPPGNPAQAASNAVPPLTPWESWEYQAATHRQSIAEAKESLTRAKEDLALSDAEIQAAETRLAQMKEREMGPLVSFVWKPGLARRI